MSTRVSLVWRRPTLARKLLLAAAISIAGNLFGPPASAQDTTSSPTDWERCQRWKSEFFFYDAVVACQSLQRDMLSAAQNAVTHLVMGMDIYRAYLREQEGQALVPVPPAPCTSQPVPGCDASGAPAGGFVMPSNYEAPQVRTIEAAVAFYGTAISLDPGMAAAWVYRGEALLDAGRTDEALTDLNEAVRLAPADPLVRLYRAAARRNAMNIGSALSDVDDVLAMQNVPKNVTAEAHSMRGHMLTMIGNAEEALVHFDYLIDHRGLYFDYMQRGYAFAMVGRYDEAVVDFSLAWIRAENDLQRLEVSIASVSPLMSSGRMAEAVDHIDGGIDLANKLGARPALAHLFAWRARVAATTGQIELALHHADQAYGIDPKPEYLVLRGEMQYRDGWLAEAIQDMSEGLANADMSGGLRPRGYFFRALAYQRVGYFEKAMNDFKVFFETRDVKDQDSRQLAGDLVQLLREKQRYSGTGETWDTAFRNALHACVTDTTCLSN